MYVVTAMAAAINCRDGGRRSGIGRSRPFRPRHHEVQRARTNRAFFPESVRDIPRVDPHCELRWEVLGNVSQARSFGRFADDWVHLGVDSDAAVSTALTGIFGVPVVFESPRQQLLQLRSELVGELMG